MSQILSLKVGEKFLLIQSKRRSRLGPIGGVIKYFDAAQSELAGTIGFDPEFKVGDDKYDLRGYLAGKDFSRFLRWYATGRGREQAGLAREIEEEFLEIGIPGIVKHVRRPEFELERVVHEGPIKIKDRGYWQYRFFEVFRLREDSDVSKKLADYMRAQAEKSSKLALVDIDEIKIGQVRGGKDIIGDSAGYLFSNSAHGIIPPPLI